MLAGCARLVEGDGDDAGLVGALRARGLHARWLSWDDPEVLRADLVILRATEDYGDRLGEFLAWTTTVRHLLNAPDVVAWNTDKRYLFDLADRGVPVVASAVFAPGQIGGATALVFLGGRPSHAVTRDGPVDPDFEVWDVGTQALAAAAARLGIDVGELLYARAEIVGGQDDPRLVELQLVDPSLGWMQLDTETRGVCQREFTLCVESALERLGLGPFSHRRP